MATSAVRSGRGLSRVRQALVDPPGVPERSQLAVGGPTIIEVELVVQEGTRVIDDDGTPTSSGTRRCCAVRKLTRNVPYPQTR